MSESSPETLPMAPPMSSMMTRTESILFYSSITCSSMASSRLFTMSGNMRAYPVPSPRLAPINKPMMTSASGLDIIDFGATGLISMNYKIVFIEINL